MGRCGHVFIAEQVENKIVFIDPQVGKKDCSYYFSTGYIKPSKTRVLRIDGKEFSNLINNCIEIEEKKMIDLKTCEIAAEYEHNPYIDAIIDTGYGVLFQR